MSLLNLIGRHDNYNYSSLASISVSLNANTSRNHLIICTQMSFNTSVGDSSISPSGTKSTQVVERHRGAVMNITYHGYKS